MIAILLVLLMVGGTFFFLESAKGVDATTITGTGTSYDPYRDTIDIGANEVDTYFQQDYGTDRRVLVGTNFNITKYTSGSTEISVTSISTGSGLTLSNGSLTGQLRTSAIQFTFTVETNDGVNTTSETYSVLPVRYTVTFVGSPSGAGGANQSTLYVADFTQYYAGSLSNSIEFATGEVILPSANPGYEFDHWSSTSGYISRDTTITAYFNALPNPVVSFVSNPSGLNMGLSNITVPVGTTATVSGRTISFSDGHTITAPETIGNYVFSYWNPSGTGGSGITSNKTFTAYYVSYNYSLSFDGNGNTGGTVPSTMTSGPTSSSSYSFTIPYSVPTKTDYMFTGWSYNTSDVTGQYQPGETITLYSSNQTRTLHAIWARSCTITFASYPAGLISINPITVPYGTTWSSSDTTLTFSDGQSVTARDDIVGKTFGYWAPMYNDDPIIADKTFTAYYTTTQLNVYIRSSPVGLFVTDVITMPYGTTWTTSGNVLTWNGITPYTAPTPDVVYNCRFVGWSPASGTLTADTYIDVQYEFIYELSFDLNGGSTGPSTVTEYSADSPYYITVPATEPTWADHRFLGWYDSGTGSTYQAGDNVRFNRNNQSIQLMATWEGIYKYQITLNYQNPAEETVVVNYPSDPTQWTTEATYDYTVASMPSGHYTAHTFIGWAEAEGAMASLQPGDVLRLVGTPNGTTTKTLYAVWIEGPYEYALYFDPNGGTGTTQTLGPIQDSQMSHTFAITGITDPTAPATYSFIGWTTTDTYDGTTPLYNNGDVFTVYNTDVDVVLQTFTLYAVYAMTYTYVLDYHLEGGSDGPSDETVVSTLSTHVFTVSPISPSLAGSTFIGWAFTANGEVAVFGGDELEPLTGVAGSTVTKNLYAIYVTYDDSVTRWSNDSYNGSVSVIYHLENPTTKTYYLNESAILFNFAGRTADNTQAIFTPSGYTLSVIVNSVPAGMNNYNVSLTATVKDANNVVVTSEYVEIGKWASFIVTLSPLDYTVKLTKVSMFQNFTSYTENDTTTILDFSNASMRQHVFETPLSMYELTYYYLGNAPKQQVCKTMVFMETYGVVMIDPVFDVDQYWPNKDGLRLNLFSFALIGNTATINGTTFYLDNGRVTVNYVGDSSPYKLMTDDTQPYKTKVLNFTNLSITWQNGHCYLAFNDANGLTLDMGTYTDRVISMGGIWYFQSGVYESYTVTETSIVKDWTSFNFDFRVFGLIALGLLVLAGVGMRMMTDAKLGDYLILFGAIGVIITMIGGLL